MASPFLINVSDEKLQLLKQKLALASFPDELDGAEWDYGVPLSEIRDLVVYWRESYDWRKHEAELNASLPQFTTDIQVDGFETLNIHFVHKLSSVEQAIPLLFIHGWPGSFIEVKKILPLLTAPAEGEPAFHVVAVGLPGFGFSQGSKKKGFSLAQYAEVCHKVMLALGYEKYVTQGGDWGSLISRTIGGLYGGSHCMGWHVNFAIGLPPRFFSDPLTWIRLAVTPFTPAEKVGLTRFQWYQSQGNGYFVLQRTKPQTLGYSLADSPVGLLAWIYEKLRDWSDNYPWTKDEILTWISIYLFSREGPAASLRIYYEAGKDVFSVGTPMRKIPLGISYFPREIIVPPRVLARNYGKVVFESTHEKGGHFASYEEPELLVKDLREMYGKAGPAFSVVRGHEGYDKPTDPKL